MHILKVLGTTTALLLATTGCGLLDAAFTIDTDWVAVKLDTAQMGLKIPGASTVVPSIPCSSNSQCGAIKCGGSGYSCALKCVSGKCEIHLTAETSSKVDLSSKIKNETSAGALSKVELDSIVYHTDVNTLTFDTPSIGLYVGPQAATSTTSSGVQFFAQMPSIKSKQTPNAKAEVTDAGANALEGFIKQNYQTPFKMLGKAALKFRSGDPLPQGRIELKFKAYFKIDPL